MYRYDFSTNLKDLSRELDSFGYDSVLLVLHSQDGDWWTKAANAVDPTQKLKYLIAVRPYLFSPQYLAMLTTSFHEFAPNRVMLNFVAGDNSRSLQGEGHKATENYIGIIGQEEDLKDPTKRKEYLKLFLSKFLNDVRIIQKDIPGMPLRKPYIPKILLSGSSDEMLQLAKDTSDSVVLYYESFIENPERFTAYNFGRIFTAVSLLVTDTDEEAEEIFNSIPEDRKIQGNSPLYGSRETIRKKILELQNMGVTDILFSQFNYEHPREPVHQFLAQLSREGILSK